VEWLADLFETNRIIVLSVYGQVFFVLGLAIALQSLKRSALAFARPLPWLAGFGIVHGFMEWGYLFVPVQAGFLPLPIIEGLLVLQLVLKVASFALLFQFGVELLISTQARWRRGPFGHPWLRLVPSAALVFWLVATLTISASTDPSFTPHPGPWLPTAEIGPAIAAVGAPLAVGDVTSRVLLAFPGAALCAVGLQRSIAPLRSVAAPLVVLALRIGAIAFAAYAVVGGLIGMPVPFPPWSVLNGQALRDAIGIPIEVFRSGTGFAIALAVIVSLDLFEQETDRILAESRRRELLLRERERIGRDLHDGIIQSIYAAGLHLEEATASIGPTSDGARARIGTVMEELNQITSDIRSYIFDLRSASVETRDAEEIVAAVADELRANTLVDIDMVVGGDYRPRLSPEQAEQLRHIVQEAFSNILRHARARRVRVELHCTRRRLTLHIRDDGVGYDTRTRVVVGRGGRAQGLANMRHRAAMLGARLDIDSAQGRGTAVSLTMPVATSRRTR
jgi:signal transduction histidine kinase